MPTDGPDREPILPDGVGVEQVKCEGIAAVEQTALQGTFTTARRKGGREEEEKQKKKRKTGTNARGKSRQ